MDFRDFKQRQAEVNAQGASPLLFKYGKRTLAFSHLRYGEFFLEVKQHPLDHTLVYWHVDPSEYGSIIEHLVLQAQKAADLDYQPKVEPVEVIDYSSSELLYKGPDPKI